jgi:hypothetical protein
MPVASLPHVSLEVVGKTLDEGFDAHHWNYDSLMEKWKTALREDRKTSNGMVAQRRLSATPTVKLNNRKLHTNKNFNEIREEAMESAAGANSHTQHSSPKYQNAQQPSHQVQQAYPMQQPEDEIIHIGQTIQMHHPQPQLQHSIFPPKQTMSSRPVSPQFTPHLTAQSAIRDQRRPSAQLSPHSMPSQSRRVSVQLDQASPHPTPHPQSFQQPPPPRPLPQEAHMSVMQFNTQPPALSIPQVPASQTMAIPSPYSTTPIAPPPPHMQQWAPPPQAPTPDQQYQAHNMQHQLSQETHRIQQQAQQMSQELHAQHMHVHVQHQQLQHQMQTQSMPPTPVAPQGPYPPQMPDAPFQHLALQVPQPTDRRNSAPMIDLGHHAMMPQQVVETPQSAGAYMGMMNFGNPGMAMGMVNGTHAG